MNYYYDLSSDIKPFTHSQDSNKDSLPPFNALRKEPVFQDGFWPCEKDGEWVLVENFTGEIVYNKSTKEPMIIKEFGPLSNDYTLLEPGDFDEWSGDKWVKNELLERQYEISLRNQEKQKLIDEASQQIAILEYGENNNELNEKEKQLLDNLRQYRFLVNRIDTSDLNCSFPELNKLN